MFLRFLVPILSLLLGHPASAFESAEGLQELRGVMTDRLVVMEQIAKSKWNAGRPVEDVEREAAVLEMTTKMAVAEGLDPDRATRMVRAQMEAAKIVQSAFFAEWRAASVGKHADVADIAITLRPEIGRLTRELIVAVVAAQDRLQDCHASRVLMPVPDAVSGHPQAWAVAVEGVLATTGPCPAGDTGR